MKKDKLIKNELLSACQPEKSFEQFCRENNLSAEKRTAPAAKKQSVRGWLLKAVMPALAVDAVVLAIVLPITLKGNVVTPDGGSSAPTLNMHSDTITIGELLADNEVTLLNTEYMFDERTSFRKMYLDDNDNVDAATHLGYSVTADVYGARINGVPYVYGFTLTTAKSNALAVIDKTEYNGCDKAVSYGGVQYKYKVDVGFTVSMRVYYSIGKYEYFMSVTPFGTAAIADEKYMLTFLRLAFDTVDGAEKIDLS
ncbi:MAG: hypothetical protein K2L88_02330 [Clostridiales bacterium]|nr:hypothetical protein [Clostridiales bacterium]